MDAAAPPSLRARLAPAAAGAAASLTLAAVNLAVFAWIEAHGSSTDTATLVRFGALERGRVWSGEVWRLVTAAFVHAGWAHLGWNTVTGVLGCPALERALGKARFLLVYLVSAVAASALSLLGQDVVSAGASGALFGMLGAMLALHLRALGSWRAFARSRATRWVVAGTIGWSLAASAFVRIDDLAHVGGLAAGGAATWLLTRPGRSGALAPLAAAAALALLVTAAVWPRAGMTAFEASELELRTHAALRAHDTAEARRLVDLAGARGHSSDTLEYFRALVLVQEGRLERALDAARPLARSAPPAVRGEAVKTVIGVAKTLAYRAYTGDGARRDAARALGYMEEACAAGDAESCANAARVRGGPAPAQ